MGKNNNKNKKKKKSRKGEVKGEGSTLLEGISNIDLSDKSPAGCGNENDNKCMEISDDELFKEPPPKEDCPICLLPIPFANGFCNVYTAYQACCGKTLCMGCNVAAGEGALRGDLKDLCAFCRTPSPLSNEDFIQRCWKRVELNDPEAMTLLAGRYKEGASGLPQDIEKALGLFHRAAELGSCIAHNALSTYYSKGIVVAGKVALEKDEKKSAYHSKLAAIGGHEFARHATGCDESHDNKWRRAMKHLMISARAGSDESLYCVKDGYKGGYVTKVEYASTLRAHKESQDEMKSEQRVKGTRFWLSTQLAAELKC